MNINLVLLFVRIDRVAGRTPSSFLCIDEFEYSLCVLALKIPKIIVINNHLPVSFAFDIDYNGANRLN